MWRLNRLRSKVLSFGYDRIVNFKINFVKNKLMFMYLNNVCVKI